MGVRRVVLRSLEDAGGLRCVDIRRDGDDFGWAECRRDPEDGSGWRHLAGTGTGGFGSAGAAETAARAVVGRIGARG